jgi:hypothetical protein
VTIHFAPHAAAGFQKKITVKQLKASTVLACKCGNTFLVNGRCRNCEAQAIVDKAKQRGDKSFNFEQAVKQQNQSLRKEANIEASQRAHKLSMASDSELPYTGRIQNFIGQSRRDIVEPWEGGAPPAPSAAKTTPPPTSLNFCPQATAVNATCLV